MLKVALFKIAPNETNQMPFTSWAACGPPTQWNSLQGQKEPTLTVTGSHREASPTHFMWKKADTRCCSPTPLKWLSGKAKATDRDGKQIRAAWDREGLAPSEHRGFGGWQIVLSLYGSGSMRGCICQNSQNWTLKRMTLTLSKLYSRSSITLCYNVDQMP